MEDIRDNKLEIIGERFRSFFELYRAVERRGYNALYRQMGDGSVLYPVDVSPACRHYDAQDTKQALLYGSDLYKKQFEGMRLKATKALHDRYEWHREPTADTSVHGQSVIVERYMAGHPEAFRRALPRARRKRSVHIFYDAMCPASTPTDKRIQAGCAVLAVVEALEKMGYEVALSYAIAKCSGRPGPDPTLLLEVLLKDYGEPFNEPKMEFPLASKSVLFHMGSWWTHRFAHTPINYGNGEGFAVHRFANRVASMKEYAKRHGGAYVSESIVEIKMKMDPVALLQYVLGEQGYEDELAVHQRAQAPIEVATEPNQGRLIWGWDPTGTDIAGDEDSGDELGKKTGQHLEALSSGDTDSSADSNARHNNNLGDIAHDTYDDATHQDDAAYNQDNDAPGGQGAKAQNDSNGIHEEETPIAGRKNNSLDDVNSETKHYAGQSPHDIATSNDGSRQKSDSGIDGEGDQQEKPGSDDSKSGEWQESPEENSSKPSPGPGDADNEQGGQENARVTRAQDQQDRQEQEVEEPNQEQRKQENVMESKEFIIELRKRFISFENGEYLNTMIDEKMARRQAAKANHAYNDYKPPSNDEVGMRAFTTFAFR